MSANKSWIDLPTRRIVTVLSSRGGGRRFSERAAYRGLILEICRRLLLDRWIDKHEINRRGSHVLGLHPVARTSPANRSFPETTRDAMRSDGDREFQSQRRVLRGTTGRGRGRRTRTLSAAINGTEGNFLMKRRVLFHFFFFRKTSRKRGLPSRGCWVLGAERRTYWFYNVMFIFCLFLGSLFFSPKNLLRV